MSQNKEIKTGISLFKLAGFQVSLDWSWFFLAVLITWSLAAGYFPSKYPNLAGFQYLIMGILGAVGLFLSIILHEFCHSLVGRYYGMPILGIKLFIFGGIAELGENPKSPKAEFFMSFAGPLFSIVFAVLLHFLSVFLSDHHVSDVIYGVISYLSVINFALGIFNLLPGFPLDGGRILRSLLWWWKNDLKWATRISAGVGRFLGFLMIFFGVFFLIQGSFISGIWMGLLGLYLQSISSSSYDQIILDEVFHNTPVKNYTKKNPVVLGPKITLQDVINNYFYKYFHKLYPVLDQGKLVGTISIADIKNTPEESRENTTVEQIMQPISADSVVDANMTSLEVLQRMNSLHTTRFIVLENQSLYGMITLKDLMDVFSIKKELSQK